MHGAREWCLSGRTRSRQPEGQKFVNDTQPNLKVVRRQASPTPILPTAEPLRVCVERALQEYFACLDGECPADLYAMVQAEVEAPLLQIVMHQARGNQSQASAMLGINRGTLRKKLKQYDLL